MVVVVARGEREREREPYHVDFYLCSLRAALLASADVHPAADGIVVVALAVIRLNGMSLIHVHERSTASSGLEFMTTAALSFDVALDPRA